MPHQLSGALFFAFGGLVLAYVFSTLLVDFMLYEQVGYWFIVKNLTTLKNQHADLFTQVGLIFLFLGMGGAVFGSHFSKQPVTKEGKSKWQTQKQMRKNGLLKPLGEGFVIAKTTKPGSIGKYLNTAAYPNCLVVAPTGAGKNVGFIYPTLYTFAGSTVTLDIKGENYDETAATRAVMGDKVYRFAPADVNEKSIRYNPMERISKITNVDEADLEIKAMAPLFLSDKAPGNWLDGGIDLFTALGLLAWERGTLTLGDMHKLLTEGGGKLAENFAQFSDSTKYDSIANKCKVLSILPDDTIGSYLSVLNNAGFSEWSNGHVADITSRNDISFENLRRERTSIYFVIPPKMIKAFGGLIRLFFNELTATIQTKKPGADEPHKVLILLDEFHKLGHMAGLAEDMTTIRGYGGSIAIVTQTLPQLDALYEYDGRLTIQGNATVKLYMTPNEEKTIEDLSKACGMTTKIVRSKSKQSGLGEKTTYSERTEERPLLTEDDARRLSPDAAIIIVKGQHPIIAEGIKHFDDPYFNNLHDVNKEPGEKLIAEQKVEREKALKAQNTEDRVTRLEKKAGIINTESGLDVEKGNDIEFDEQETTNISPVTQKPTTGDLEIVGRMANDVLNLNDEIYDLPDKTQNKQLETPKPKQKKSILKKRTGRQFEMALDLEKVAAVKQADIAAE